MEAASVHLSLRIPGLHPFSLILNQEAGALLPRPPIQNLGTALCLAEDQITRHENSMKTLFLTEADVCPCWLPWPLVLFPSGPETKVKGE